MELFHEYKNKYFHLVLKILNLCQNGLCKDDVLKIIEDEEYDERLISKDFKTFEGMILNEYEDDSLNLLKEKDNRYYSILNREGSIPVKIRFSNIEKTWLNGMIQDKTAKELLGEEIVNKLSESLKDIHEGNNNVIEFTNKNVNKFEYDFKKLNRIFFTILDAINNEKLLIYTNVDRDGNEHKDKLAIPLRIEYSLKDDKFRVSMYSIEDKRPIKVNLHTLKEINVTEKSSNLKREDLIKKLKEKKYCEEPVTIILKDKRGAMERCFMSFSSFERSSKLIDSNTYEVDIYYYTFQEDDVISKIISLGPYVTVKGPERIRNTVIEKIKKAYEYQVMRK